jgi:hypothetical protein
VSAARDLAAFLESYIFDVLFSKQPDAAPLPTALIADLVCRPCLKQRIVYPPSAGL